VTSRIREAHRAKALLRRSAVGLTALALAAGICCGSTMTATADPALTIADAKSQMEQLEVDAAALDQEYAGVKQKIDTGTQQLKTKQADVKTQTAKVAQMRLQVGQVALAQFQNRNLDTTAQLFLTSETDDFLSQISTVEKVSENQNTVLQNFQSEQATLAGLQRSAQTDLATLTKQQAELAQLRASSEQKLAESKAVLAKLTEEERQRLADEEKARAEEAAKAAQAADATRTGQISRGSDRGTTAGSSRGAIALAFAEKQIGKPYRFGATGPSAYDCSGLTGAAWKAAGVSLPRTSQEQFKVGKSVAIADLQPGDLVFFYPPAISHVGLYAGNGTVLHASNPSKPVGYLKMSYMRFAGAKRVG
jgi:cell wall-associated NlpC family hydrolase